VMELVQNVDLNEYAEFLTCENLSEPISFRVWANGETGEVRIYDPTDPEFERYYYFFVDRRDLPLRGDWISLRVNGGKFSFGMGLE